MDDREFWAQAFFGSAAWKERGNATLAAIDADAALSAYRERFGAVPAETKATMPSARNTLARLGMEREKLASLERTQSQDSPAIAESRAKIARLEQLIMANR